VLLLLFLHIIISFLCVWTGYLVDTKLFRSGINKSLATYAITGLIFLTGITQAAILFIPAGSVFRLVLLAILIFVLIIYRRQLIPFFNMIMEEWRSVSLPLRVLFFVIWLIILMINAGPVLMDDTESYHIQMIMWIKEYGTVPGLVNLHERFGFNSSWFSTVALFSFFPGSGAGYTVINGILSLWLVYWIISRIGLFIRDSGVPAAFSFFIILVLCMVVWPLARGNAATANYDFITTVILLILLAPLFIDGEHPPGPGSEWILWPVYLFTVRIINYPVLLLALFSFFVLATRKKTGSLFILVCAGLFLVIPFLARNIIISGYPFYPAMYADWFNYDWKADPGITERLLEYIKYYNRVSTGFMDIEQTRALGAAWIPAWFNHLFWFDKLLLIPGLAGILWSVYHAIMKFSQRRKLFPVVMMLIVWIVAWMITSPDPRFIYGILLLGILFLLFRILTKIADFFFLNRLLSMGFILLFFISVFYLFSKTVNQPPYRNWALPARLPEPELKEVTIDGIRFHLPERINDNWNARCYASPLPCLYEINPNLECRGKDLKKGFRLKK